MCTMQRLWWTAALAVPLFASSAQAQFFNPHPLPPAHLDGGLTLNFNLFAGGGQTQLGPWYQYWPYLAHFQMGPPLGAASPGPSFMTLPPSLMGQQPMMMGQPPAMGQPTAPPTWTPPTPTPLGPGQNGMVQRSGFQPVGYSYYGSAPSYWYGR
jgi:hypothetical protein